MGKTAILAVKIIGDAIGAQKAFDATDKGAQGLMGKLGKISPTAVAGAIVTGAAIGGKALYGLGATWDEVRDTIRAGTGATGAALEGMFTSAKNVAASVPAAIEDIGPVVADLNTRMGLTGGTLETVAAQYLEAGRILGDTVDIEKTSAAFNMFGVKGSDVEGAMDDLFRVSQATGVGMNDLADIVSKAGPGLTNLGFSFQDSAALAGTLDKAGLDANATLGAMEKGLVTLARSGEKPEAAFKRVVGELEGFIATGDTAGALDLASTVFGTRGAAKFVSAVQSGTVGVEDLMGAAGVTGDTIIGLGQETADAAEKWDILKNKALVALEPIASKIFDGAGAALDWLLNIVETTDWTPFQAGVETAMGALDGLWPFLESVGDLIGQLAPITQATFEGIMGIIGPALDIITGIIDTGVAIIKGDWSGAWTGIKDIAGGVVDLVKGIVRNWIGQLEGIVKAFNLRDLFTNIMNGAKDAVTTGISAVVDWFRGIPRRLYDATTHGYDWLHTVGGNMMTGLLNGVRGMASKVVDSVRGVVDNAIGAAKRLLGIASPSKVFTLIGAQTGQGLARGLLGQTDAVASASAAMVDAAIPTDTPTIAIDADYTAAGYTAAGSARARAGSVNININGALDPVAVARQIRQLLNDVARYDGRVALNGASS